MMSCKKATHLMSQQLDRKLAAAESMALRSYLMMCSVCAKFKKNMALLRTACIHIAVKEQSE